MRNEHEHPGPAREPEAAGLSAALRREAEEAPCGPAPVEAVMRAGRGRRRRGRTAVGAAALVVMAAPLLTSAWPFTPDTGPASSDWPAATAPAQSPAPVSRLHTVEPYEPVDVAPGWRLGLLPEGRQNSVLAPAESYSEALEGHRSPHIGDNIRPRSISSGYTATEAGGVLLVNGTWRLDEPPGRVVITAAGRTLHAGLYTLPGSPGWGVYVVDTTGLPRFTAYTVTAYDSSGRVFDTLDVRARS